MLNNLRCWWFGCESDPQDPAPPEHAECMHCGQIVGYESMAVITRYNKTKEFLNYCLFRRWWPARCSDCGHRFGSHEDCLPF